MSAPKHPDECVCHRCEDTRTELATVAARARAEALREAAVLARAHADAFNKIRAWHLATVARAIAMALDEIAAAPPPAEPAPPVAAPEPKPHVLVFICNGEDVDITIDPSKPLGLARTAALSKSGNTGRPPAEWRIRTTAGAVLEPESSARDYGLVSWTRLILSLDAGSGGAAPEDGTARQMLAKLLRASDEYDAESSPGLHDAWTITRDAARAYLASTPVAAERAAPNPYKGAIIHALLALLKATYLDQVPDEATNDWWRGLATTARREYDHLRSGAPPQQWHSPPEERERWQRRIEAAIEAATTYP
jgi:hypothetical protein